MRVASVVKSLASRVSLFLITSALILSCFSVQAFSGGSGTEADPY